MSGEKPSSTNANSVPEKTGWDELVDDAARYQKWMNERDKTSRGNYSRNDIIEHPRLEGETTEEYAARLRAIHAEEGSQDDEFAGERNINDKTGKERTFSEFDLYPRQPGETPQEYGERLKRMHELTRQYQEQEEEQAKVIDEEDKTKIEDEEKSKIEDEEKLKIEEEEKLKREIEEKRKLIDAIDEELARRPLVAINADFTHDKKDLAHDFAEQQLNAEVASAKGVKGFVSRIWKGNLFKKYYQKKYERQIFEGERDIIVNGETMDLDDVVQDGSGSAIERFVTSVTNDYGEMVHTKAGEKLTEADAKTTEAVKEIIEWFAAAEIPEGGSIDDLRREFGNRVNHLKAEKRDQGEEANEALINNYFNVAMQARERVAHGIAMEQVMEGFRVYEADVRNNIRTEAHRDNIDKIVNKFESSKIGQFIPAEVIAAALGTAYSLTQTGARAAAGAGLGIGVSGVFAGLRERNRVTEDRARMLRDAAVGLEYSGTNGEEVEGGRMAKKRAKYEARIGGTLYDLRSAEELTANLQTAMENGANGENTEALLQAIAEARVRVDFSDSESKDLISYSDANKVGDERLALDLALIRAERSLSDADREKLQDMKAAVRTSITEEVDKDDSDFRKERTKLALKASAKTIALGAATFFASQEIMAAIDPNKIGIFEKAGLLKTENNQDAEETILASAFGFNRGEYAIKNVSPEESYRLEEAGYKRVETRAAWAETKTDVVEMDPASAATQNFKYDGWANNGTTVSDGNELRAYLQNGQFSSGMSGNSTLPNGQVLNYNDLAAAGRIKGYLTIGGAKFELQGALDNNGNMIWGDNGVFTTATGETIKAIGDNGEKLYKYFEIALDNGTDAEGITHIIPFATDTGRDAFTGTIQKVTERVVEHPATYTMVKQFAKVPVTDYTTEQVVRGITGSGVILPHLSRVGLGEAAPVATTETEPTAPEESAEEIIDIYATPGSEPDIPTFTNPEGVPGTSIDREEIERAVDTASNISRFFGDNLGAIGQEGIDLLNSEEPAGEAMTDRIRSWWNGLDDGTKQQVRTYVRTLQGSDRGDALRMWLTMNPTV